METFRQICAFPLYAFVIFLMGTFARQVGLEGLKLGLYALLTVSGGLWLWGRAQRQPATTRGLVSLMLAAALTVGGIWLGLEGVQTRARAASGGQAASDSLIDGFWRPWSPERVAALRAEQKPVFVNFTADWCVSCKVNEKVVFDRADVRAAFHKAGITPLLGDWTVQDPLIASALAAHGREGVPLYLYYPPGSDPDPRVLPQVLTPGGVIATVGGQAP